MQFNSSLFIIMLASLERVLPLRGIARPRSGHIVSRLRDISYLYIALRSNISCVPQGAVSLIERYSKSQTIKSARLCSLPGLREGVGMGTDLTIQNYEDIGEGTVAVQDYLQQACRRTKSL